MKMTDRIIAMLTLVTLALQVHALDVTSIAGELSGKVDTGVTDLKVTGTMNAADFYFIANHLKQLRTLDLTDVEVVACDFISQQYWKEGFVADELPVGALGGLGVTSVKLPSSLKCIGKAAFAGCFALTEVVMPASLDSIAPYAFAGCTALPSVTLPANVRVVADGAFVHCTSLTRFEVEPASRLASLSATALMDCPALETLTLGSAVREMGERALLGAGLHQLDLTASKNLAHIGDWAMAMSPVEQVILPSSVTHVGDGAFFCDSILLSVQLGGHLEQLNDFLLAGTGLSGEMSLEGVSRIGDYAFYNASDLSVVALPATTTWLGDLSMAGMTGLKKLTCEVIEVPSLGKLVWAGVNQHAVPLTVPDRSKKFYQMAAQWRDFLFPEVWLRGDVNNDGEVNIADVNTLIDIILGGSFDNQTMLRADVNEDGEIGIADINAVIDIILNPGSYASPAVDTDDRLHLDDTSMMPGEQRTLHITLDNAARYSAIQCDIMMPLGLNLVGVDAAQGQTSLGRDLGEAWRTVMYSMDKCSFDNDKAVLTLTVQADEALPAAAQITICNIVLADDANVGWHAADCVAMVSNTTGIENLTVTADRVWTEARSLCIETRSATSAQLTAVNGMTRNISLEEGVNRFELEQGFYVVVLNGKSHKIAIR